MNNLPSSNYFQQLNESLCQYKRAIPMLLIDLDFLDQNIARLREQFDTSAILRLVVKSLPSPELLQYVMAGLGCQKLMVFHQPFLSDLVNHLHPSTDILLGKPLPVRTARYFYEQCSTPSDQFNPYRQIQWLVDTQERLVAYAQLAKTLGQKIRINLEIDVGLHRGGFRDAASFKAALRLFCEQADWLEFSGLMGYDPHVVKLPNWLGTPVKNLSRSQAIYQNFLQIIRQDFPTLWYEKLTFNGAGSPTFSLHQTTNSPLNDIAVGSALVKPGNFDIPTLSDFQAACWIATPVLKKQQGTRLPGLGKLPRWLGYLFPYLKESYFIYGGYWKAAYHYPPDLRTNPLLGESTNQSMLNASGHYPLEVDDFIFLRPWQSEAVFLQFGRITTVRAGQVTGEWSLLRQ